MKKTFAVILTAALAAAAEAAPVSFNSPVQYAGTGCAPGSAVVTGKNSSAMTFSFGKYDAANPAAAAASGMQRTACSFTVPVHVPPGFQVALMTVIWRGHAKGAAELFREYSLAGQRGQPKTSRPSGRFTQRDKVPQEYFSQCGKDVTLRINSSVRAAGPGSHIALGGTKKTGKLSLQLKWKKCL